MHDSALGQKLDQILQTTKQALQKIDSIDRLLLKVSSQQPSTTHSNSGVRVAPECKRKKHDLGAIVSAIGLASAVFSFFPHVAVSDPVQMDITDLFSYQITVTNGGILPIYLVRWSLAPEHIKLASDGTTGKSVTITLPHSADWTISSKFMSLAVKPGADRHSAIQFQPGGEMIVNGPANYQFQIRPEMSRIGTLTPGDQFTFTTEGIISAPSGATYDDADFAVAIKYVPVFPPIPMQTCSHFYIFKDRQGVAHWFRATNHCDRFPWLHHWFSDPDN